MREKYWFVIRNTAGRIEILSGVFDNQDDAIDACKRFENAEVAETVWG
jgi:hypothetical protein